MKKFLSALFFFLLGVQGSLATSDAIPAEAVENIVQLKIIKTDHGTITEYDDEISGILISKNGLILTDYKAAERMVMFPDVYRAIACKNEGDMGSANCAFEAKFIKGDKRRGIALLQISSMWKMDEGNLTYGKVSRVRYEGVTMEEYPFRNFVQSFGDTPTLFESVYVLGYPESWGSVLQVTVASVIDVYTFGSLIDMPITKGVTGGGVFNQDDELIGMVVTAPEGERERFIETPELNSFLIENQIDIPLAGSLEVFCSDTTVTDEKGRCQCDAGYSWDNSRWECKKIESTGYCGENSYRVGDSCVCHKGFEWGTLEGGTQVQCIAESEKKDEQEVQESTSEKEEGNPTYKWKELIFKPVYELKVFAKKIRNGKALLIWKPVEGNKAHDCFFDFWDSAGEKGKVIFQKKNIALIKIEDGKKYHFEISNCSIDETEQKAWSGFYVE